MPALQRLRIHAREEFCRAKDNSIPSFEVAPNLTAVELWQSRVRLPWQQLTRFSADRLSTADCLHVLRMASSLIDCALISIGDRVARRRSRHMWKLLPHLSIPALTSLAIWVGGDDEADHFVSFLSRSRVELQHLDLYCAYCSFDRALPFMASLSSLTLKGIDRPDMMTIFRSLRDSTFLPNLRSLGITIQNASGRWNADVAPRLESFRMVWIPISGTLYMGFNQNELRENLAKSGTIRRFLDVVDQGMKLHIGTNSQRWV
ncbi:hypothetical protein DFH09DRAFT_1093657 [Mycena vulgaris]|nr:hypothetical protein DFH09DRAFT_1093657 [Mycena vulgaris]